jgi:hypothetical protein
MCACAQLRLVPSGFLRSSSHASKDIAMIRASAALASLQRAILFMAVGSLIVVLPILFTP